MLSKSSRPARIVGAATVFAATAALALNQVTTAQAATMPVAANVAQQQANGDLVLPLSWNVKTDSTIKGLSQKINISGGKFDGTVTVPKGSKQGRLVGKMELPSTTSQLKLGPIPLAKTTMKMTPVGDVQGTIDLNQSPAMATNVANLDVQIVSIKPMLVPFNLVGNKCRTEKPVVMTMKGAVDVTKPNTFTSTYDLPKFKDCGLSTWIVNMLVPGGGNTQTSTFSPRTPHQNPVQQPKPNPVQQPKPMPVQPNPGLKPMPVQPKPVQPNPVQQPKPMPVQPNPGLKPKPVQPKPVQPMPGNGANPGIKPMPVKPMPVKPMPADGTKPVVEPKPVIKPMPKPEAGTKPVTKPGKADGAAKPDQAAKPADPAAGKPAMPNPQGGPAVQPGMQQPKPVGMPVQPGKKSPAQGKNVLKKFGWLLKFA